MCLDTNYKLLKKGKHMQVSSNKKKMREKPSKTTKHIFKANKHTLELHNF